MSKQTESSKRDFVNQMIAIAEEETAKLTEKGFDPAMKIDALKVKSDAATKAEISQQEAAAKAKEATTLANEALNDAYAEASNFADLLSGLLGKESEIVKKIRKFRK